MIKNKRNKKFVKLDVQSFYPSIRKELLMNALDLARQYCNIEENEIEIILACRKSLLFHKNITWQKIDQFDVAQGALDSAEISELIGIYMLHKIKEKLGPLQIGMYRDDILWVTDGSGPENERVR